MAVVGESGSGKSVTALSIMRLVELGTRGKIENGEILFRQPGGEVIDLVQQRGRAKPGNAISMIFQERSSLNRCTRSVTRSLRRSCSIRVSKKRRPLSGCSRCSGLSGFLSRSAWRSTP